MFEHPKSGIGYLADFFPDRTILPAKEQQWISFPQNYTLDFCDENCVVPSLLGRLEAAL